MLQPKLAAAPAGSGREAPGSAGPNRISGNHLLLLVSGLGLLACDDPLLRAAGDLDLAGLHLFRDLTGKFDREQAITELRALHLDLIAKREAAL